MSDKEQLLKLANCIERGIAVRPYGLIGDFFLNHDQSCVVGAAFEGFVGALKSQYISDWDIEHGLVPHFPVLETMRFGDGEKLLSKLFTMNDIGGLSREEIVQWLRDRAEEIEDEA